MKKIILTITTMLMIYMSGSAQNQILNGGFEDWANQPTFNGFLMPDHWFDGNGNVIKDSVSRTGNYAVRLEGDPIIGSLLTYGWFVCDSITGSCYYSGNPFNERPAKLGFWLKYNTLSNDSVIIQTSLTKWDFNTNSRVFVANSKLSLHGNVNQFAYYEMEYDYSLSLFPDTLIIQFILGNRIFVPSAPGSYLVVDDVTLGGRSVSGTIFHDIDSNGIQDTGENGVSGHVIKIEPGPLYAVTDNNGDYVYPIDSGINYTISYEPQQYWDAYSGNVYTAMAVSNDTSITNLNFGIHPTDSIIDVRISVSASRFRCSANSNIWIDYKNYGTTTENAIIKLVIDTAQTFVSSVPPPDSVSGHHLFWFHNSFTPFSHGHINVIVTNPGFQAIGDTLSVTAFIEPAESEYAYSEHSGEVRCSWDPNDKNVSPKTGEENYVLHGKQLEYLIRFQNTGNDTAYHVTIADTIDDVNLDISTMKIMGYSHPMTFSIEGQNIVIFRFNNIMLPDSNVNELASHGYVKYTIQPQPNLAENTVVENTAYIYFDMNPAVVTNTIHSTYVSEIIVSVSEKTNSDVNIYPNPTNGTLYIDAKAGRIEKVMVYDIAGKEIQSDRSNIINLGGQPDGVYFITIVTDKGAATRKVMIAR